MLGHVGYSARGAVPGCSAGVQCRDAVPGVQCRGTVSGYSVGVTVPVQRRDTVPACSAGVQCSSTLPGWPKKKNTAKPAYASSSLTSPRPPRARIQLLVDLGLQGVQTDVSTCGENVQIGPNFRNGHEPGSNRELSTQVFELGVSNPAELVTAPARVKPPNRPLKRSGLQNPSSQRVYSLVGSVNMVRALAETVTAYQLRP